MTEKDKINVRLKEIYTQYLNGIYTTLGSQKFFFIFCCLLIFVQTPAPDCPKKKEFSFLFWNNNLAKVFI